MEELPENIPLFPLPGALLLPNSRLPLNIFEPRYINMVEDAIATKHRLIGMIQPIKINKGKVQSDSKQVPKGLVVPVELYPLLRPETEGT